MGGSRHVLPEPMAAFVDELWLDAGNRYELGRLHRRPRNEPSARVAKHDIRGQNRSGRDRDHHDPIDGDAVAANLETAQWRCDTLCRGPHN